MDTRGERAARFADIHLKARLAANRSQDYMAMELGVNKRTVQNWEKGISSPSFFQSLEWFQALYTNPFPAYLSVIYPKEMNVTGKSSDEEIDQAFNALINNLSIRDKRALLYLYYGNHGSNPYSVIQLMLAHLHLPIKERLADAISVCHRYKLEKAMGNHICKDNIQPDIDNLLMAIEKAEKSAIQNEYGYSLVERKKETD